MDSTKTMELWKEYKRKAVAKGSPEENIWGLNWTQPHPYEDKYDLLPE